MSEIKTKISTYNDVVDLFGEEKAADMLSEALDWSTINPKNDKKNIMERKPLLLDPYMTYEDEDYCKHIVAGFLGDRDAPCISRSRTVGETGSRKIGINRATSLSDMTTTTAIRSKTIEKEN